MPGANVRNDLFDYDAGLDDILRESTNPNTTTTGNNDGNNSNNNAGGTNQKGSNSGGGGGLGLGLDEEVEITRRKRAPIPKLDESRLLSQNGIPKLRSAAKTKLKLKGKGHEFSDAARLLTFYQLWLDDLYPRAKFEDALSMVEKLGHSKRMQVMRREWIDEGKPMVYRREEDVARREDDVGPRDAETSGGGDGGDAVVHGEGSDDVGGARSLGIADDLGGEQSLFGDGQRVQSSNVIDDGEDDDLFVSDPNAAMSNPIGPTPDTAPGEEEDDLDALLDEARANGPTTASTAEPDLGSIFARLQQSNEDAFDDDWEAMNAYGM